MSGIAQRPHGLGYIHIASRWGWFVALGIVFILAGLFALVDAVGVTLVSVIFIGAMMLVSGVFSLIHAFMMKTWQSSLLSALAGALYIIGGVLIMQEPIQGSMIITIFLVISLILGGILRMVMALRHRELRGWWLMLIGGLVSVGVGALLMATLPWSGLWLLGTLIGVELVMQGATWLRLGMDLRHLNRTAR